MADGIDARDHRLWFEGMANNCNIVRHAFASSEIVGVAFVANARDRASIIDQHNNVVRELIRTASLR